MGKTAFIFPGQGAQYPGMGKDFYEESEKAKEIFKLTGEVCGHDPEEFIFKENELLDQTEYTQIAMMAVELAISAAMKEAGMSADMYAGLSLGEYAAIAAAEVMSVKDILRVVRKRGIYMQNAYPVGGAMSAVLGLESDKTDSICAKVAEEMKKPVSVANYNCPGQIVITGASDAVERAASLCVEAGAKKCIRLNVSGPFHSVLLGDAADKLSEELKEVKINDPVKPYYTNVTGQKVTESGRIKELLASQICSPVRWQQCIESMIEDGADTFIEIGPGRTLAGFMKRINRDVKVCNIGTYEEFIRISEEMGA